MRTSGLTNTTSIPRGYMEWDDPSESVSRKMTANDHLAMTASRQVRDCVISDGVTSNRRVEWTPGAAGAVAGLPISIPFEFDVPSSNPSTAGRIFDLTSSSPTPDANGNRLAFILNTTGQLVLAQVGAVNFTDLRTLTYTSFRATYSGVEGLRGMVVFENGDTTTAPKIYIQGVDVSASFTLTTGGTAPNWMASTLVATKFIAGYNWPAGRFVPHAPIIGALTADEAARWTQTGRLPRWCEFTGSAVSGLTNGDFEQGSLPLATGWSLSGSGGSTVQNVAGAGVGGTNACVITQDAINSPSSVGQTPGFAFTPGRRALLRLTTKVDSTSGTPSITTDYFRNSDGSSWGLNLAASFTSYEYVVESVSTGGSFNLKRSSGLGSKTVTIDNVSLPPLGPLFVPVAQPCRILDDAGSNGIPGVLTSGMTPITTRRDWRMRATVDMSTTGNKQLFGAAVFESPTAHAIDSIETDCTGTPTLNGIGDGTTATRYAGSHALTAGRARLTLTTTPFPADSAKTGIYANVTATGGSAEKVIIRGHRID